MPKDKEGNKLTWKQFFAKWKDGINGITPIQRTKAQLNATYIQALGIVFGFCISIIYYKTMWWVGIILFGALINTGVQLIGLRQGYKEQKRIDEESEEMSLDELLGADEDKTGEDCEKCLRAIENNQGEEKIQIEEAYPCCKGECDCHMFVGGSGKPCPECLAALDNIKVKEEITEEKEPLKGRGDDNI